MPFLSAVLARWMSARLLRAARCWFYGVAVLREFTSFTFPARWPKTFPVSGFAEHRHLWAGLYHGKQQFVATKMMTKILRRLTNARGSDLLQYLFFGEMCP